MMPALIKIRHGIRFFVETLGDWLPWPVWGAALLLMLDTWRRSPRQRIGGWLALGLTLSGMILFYSLISQEVRHLLVLLPVLAWETVLQGEGALRRSRWSLMRQTLVLTGVVGVAVIVAPLRPQGELAGLEEARNQAPLVAALAREVQTWPPGLVFTDNSAVCWLAGRRGVWRPFNETVEAEIRRTVPGMDAARWIRLQGPAALNLKPADPNQ